MLVILFVLVKKFIFIIFQSLELEKKNRNSSKNNKENESGWLTSI
jgi:hypothetical protein